MMQVLEYQEGFKYKCGDTICSGGTVIDASQWEQITDEEAEQIIAEQMETLDNV